jgi:RNA-directed DNA polymerase
MEENRGSSRLNIRQPKHLAAMLQVSLNDLIEILDHASDYYQEYTLLDPSKPTKRRTVIGAKKPLRKLQGRFYKGILLPKLAISPHSHGGVRDRSVKTNVSPHIGAGKFVYKADIADFYPSIHSSKVYRLFAESLGCSPDVARLCTKLCTYSHHLALGLITSPILADQFLRVADIRIACAAQKHGLTYTRFVDDITITAEFDLAEGGIPNVVREILRSHGFRVQKLKDVFGDLHRTPVTGIVVRKSGRLDVAGEYLKELLRILDDAKCLGEGKAFCGPYYLRAQVIGKIQYCAWINPIRKRVLLNRFRRINWKQCAVEARRQCLCVHQSRLIPKQIPIISTDSTNRDRSNP